MKINRSLQFFRSFLQNFENIYWKTNLLNLTFTIFFFLLNLKKSVLTKQLKDFIHIVIKNNVRESIVKKMLKIIWQKL